MLFGKSKEDKSKSLKYAELQNILNMVGNDSIKNYLLREMSFFVDKSGEDKDKDDEYIMKFIQVMWNIISNGEEMDLSWSESEDDFEQIEDKMSRLDRYEVIDNEAENRILERYTGASMGCLADLAYEDEMFEPPSKRRRKSNTVYSIDELKTVIDKTIQKRA